MDQPAALLDDFIALARLALTGREQDVHLFLQKAARRYRTVSPRAAEELIDLVRESASRSVVMRRQNSVPVPVDADFAPTPFAC